ncbi:thiamine biosynthesis protein ThiS [Solemya pervernicosa gill symbiont]|uniref:Thiamine biosynthesis protein ThiS n=2 Tax=Gammaproteobacteria incertae sedis TaxID=118884 RepID=A0A1T2L3E0_9GAMM|nr:sulfur carrier protein ThiS [Candidatus Reidiella endopervernicosa]OOZ39520.1 thiamine biosynthesis protein ThiS [Solemya pervernicosa gill symbiont]QKQ25863.1 sulfur carrier protein ThiS [Candidatus Reidiella endopervernicosa]
MNITVNGEPREIPDGSTLAGLVEIMDLHGRRLAIELNLEIVPRSEHESQALQDGDRLEIVHAIGGGYR